MEQIKIYLDGKYLLLDAENQPGYYTKPEAMKLAEELGKRLMTNEEHAALAKCKHYWDYRLKGIRFEIPTRKPLKGLFRFLNPVIDFFTAVFVFFPASGYRDKNGIFHCVGTDVHSWSALLYDHDTSALFFSNISFCSRLEVGLTYRLPVRCVKDCEE